MSVRISVAIFIPSIYVRTIVCKTKEYLVVFCNKNLTTAAATATTNNCCNMQYKNDNNIKQKQQEIMLPRK